MRIFLDANILFSAGRSDGAVRRLLSLASEAGHELFADPYVVEEATRNIEAKGGQTIPAEVMMHISVVIAPLSTKLASQLPLPPKDQPVLAAAIALNCTHLVTGDKTHFGNLFGQAVHGVIVMSPSQLLEATKDEASPP